MKDLFKSLPRLALVVTVLGTTTVEANAGCKGSFITKGRVGFEEVDVKIKYEILTELNKDGFVDVFAKLTNVTPYYKSVDVSDVGLSILHNNKAIFRLTLDTAFWSIPKQENVTVKLDNVTDYSLLKSDKYEIIRAPLAYRYYGRYYTNHWVAESAYLSNNLRPIDKCYLFEDATWLKH